MPVFNSGDRQGRPTQFGESADIAVDQANADGGPETVSLETEQVIEPKVAKAEIQRKDRAKKRIQQLASQRDEAASERDNYKRMYEEAVSRMQVDSKAKNETLKTTLEQQYTAVLQQMGEAIKAGDAEQVVKCQDFMVNIKISLDKINTAQAQAPQEAVRQPSTIRQDRVEEATRGIPELARAWIADHSEFNTDELFHNSAITVNNQLLREGFDSETEEFYEMLTARLSPRFPEVFGIYSENSVQYRDSDDSMDQGDSGAAIVKQPVQRHQVRTQEQVVSGSARPSANTIRSGKSSNSQVTFSQPEAQLLDAWGLDKERIAKRIKHNEANRQTDGYVPIIIPRK